MRYLTLGEILLLHHGVIEDYGGAHGVRDESSLTSIIAAPTQMVFDREQHPSIHDKATVYIRNIIRFHPFVDGNKRSGVLTMAIFLNLNGYVLTCTPKELEDYAVKIATENMDIKEIATWLKTHSKPQPG